MRWNIGVAALSSLLIMMTNPTANAQSYPGNSASKQEQMPSVGQPGRFAQPGVEDEEEPENYRRPLYRERDDGRYDPRPSITQRYGRERADDEQRRRQQDPRRFSSEGALPGPMGRSDMMAMMMILMDTDGDGSVSLQEFQAGNERIFKAMDADKDGKLTLEEIRNFRLDGAGVPRR